MFTSARLTRIYGSSREIPFDDSSKFIFFSDCHRGDNSEVDAFAVNRDIYMYALDYYNSLGYAYVEIGDGDELWENDRLSTLIKAHADVYAQMRKFHNDGRFYMIWGNHDIFKCRQKFVRQNLYSYFNLQNQKFEPLFDGIQVTEGLILKYRGSPYRIFVVHGQQGDLLNDRFWPLARFLVRYVWRRLDYLSRRNPISPANNDSRALDVEYAILRWARSTNRMVISGHTHREVFAKPGQPPYFNDGCCVNPGYITGIEIQNGEILLVKWSRKPGGSGTSGISREVVAGPEKIEDYFLQNY